MLTLGTFSTLLSRELAAGYVVASPATVARLKEVRGIPGMPVATVTQRAIASLLHGGVVRRNTRAVHRALAQRRQVLQDCLVPLFDDACLAPGDGADLTVQFSSRLARDAFEPVCSRRALSAATSRLSGRSAATGSSLVLRIVSDGNFTRAVDIIGQTIHPY